DASASETGPDPGSFTVTRTGSTAAALTVDFTVSGTAASGADYAPIGTSVAIQLGAPSATITVSPIDDFMAEGNETTIVTLAAGGYTVVAPNTATVTLADDDSIGITVSAISGNTSEDGSAATFTVVLASQPTADVVVPISSSDAAEGTVSAASLTFTSADWDSPQTVTVTGVNDAATDGDATFTILTDDPTSADPAYDALSASDVADVTVVNTDNEPEVNISASDASASETGPDPGSFTVTRTGSTAAALMVDFTVGGTAAGTDYAMLGSPVMIPAGSPSATITVSPIDDFLAEGSETVVLTLAAGSYTIVAPNAATITIDDNDAFGITVSAISGNTTENGGTATFTVVLVSQPTANVVLPISSSDVAEGTVSAASLTFTSANWGSPQTVTVTGINDAATDGDVTFSILTGDPTSTDPTYDALTASDVSDVTVVNTDNEPEVSVTASDAAASEAGPDPGEFTVTRTGSTAAALTVDFTVSGTAGSGADYAPIGTSVIIPAGSSLTTIPVSPVDETLAEGSETVIVTLAAGGYTIVTPDTATVTLADDDSAGVTASAISGDTSENGAAATFTMMLTSQPTADVVIPISSSDAAEGTVSAASLTFTPADWNSPQTVTVTGVNDAATDGNVTFNILTGDPASADPTYDALTASDVSDVAVTNTDNEPEVSVTASDNSASEAGADEASMTVTRTGSTAAALTVNFTMSGTATPGTDYAAIGTAVTIPVGSPSATITISPVNDFIAEGSETATLTLAAGSYTIASPDTADVTIADDDAVGVTVSGISGPTTESGGTATFTVVLETQPTADVVIPIFSSDTAEGTVSSASLTFTAANWNSPQTVTVTGVNDTATDGNVSFTVVTGDPAAADPGYDALTAADVADVTVTNNDNEPEVTVTASDASASEPGADTGTFTITRTGSTGSDLTVDFTVGGTATSGTDYTSIGTSVTIPAGSASAPITVTALDNLVAEVNETVVLTLAAGGYTLASPSAATLTIVDDDAAGINVSSISGPTTENGGTATFSVVLVTQPTANVAVPISSSNAAEGTVSTASLSFTPANWNVPQTVTVTGVNDTATDGNVTFDVLTGDPTSADPAYDTLTASDVADVTVVNNDNEPEVAITASDPSASETGPDSGTFTVTRTGTTASDLTVPFTVGGTATSGTDYASIGTFVTIPAASPSATITVSPINDASVETPETVVVTLSPGSYTLTASTATVNISDDDAANIIVSPISGPTTESGGTATFTVVLTSQPAADVVIPLSSSNTAEGTVSTGSLTFTPANWNVPQTVTVSGVNDTITDGNVSFAARTGDPTSADPIFDALTAAGVPDVSVTNFDNEPEVTIAATVTLASEQGPQNASFTVTRTGSTTADLTVDFTTSGTASQGTDYAALGSSVTILAGQASATLTITPIDDAVQETAETVVLTLSPGTYTVTTPSSATVTISDNDMPGVSITPTSGLVTTEASGAASFSLVLNSQPTANVTITFTSSDPSEGVPLQSSVTFTPADAFTPQTVDIRGVDDTFIDGDIGYTIVTGTALSLDPLYNGLIPPDVLVTNTDDDVAGFAVIPTTGLTTTESGGQTTFTVALTSTPGAKVTLSLTSSNPAEGTVSPASLTFTPADALVPQTVTVTGANDFLVDGPASYTIATGIATSVDLVYNGLNPPDVSVTNDDDDVEGFTVTPTQGLFTNEGGSTASFTVALATIPSADVTIALSSSDTAEGTVSPASLTFTPADALVPQTVTVTGVDDGSTDGNVAYTIQLAPAASADGSYNGLDPQDVGVTNVDNEVPGVTVQPVSGLITLEAGGTATFSVVLNTVPTGSVTIPLASSDATEGSVSLSSLTFTPANALAPQTVTVTGINDTVVDGDIGYTIVTGPATSADAAYSGLNAVDISVTNLDDDVTPLPAISLSVATFQFTAAEGGSNPAPQTMTLTNSGGLPLNWTAVSSVVWLNVGPINGSLGANASVLLTASVDSSALGVGTFTGTITVSDPGASNSPQTVSVTLTLTPPPPAVTIDTPTTAETYTTAASVVALGGTATNSPSSVTWINTATGDSGIAVGTTAWTAAVPLIAGDNGLIVYGWNAGGTGSDSILVTFTAETTPPVISTASGSYVTGAQLFALNGLASDASGVAVVRWLNTTTGVGGVASGTDSWSASIPLAGGTNVVVITATDTVGNEGSLTVDISFTSPPDITAPSILINVPTTEPAYTTSVSPVTIGGLASDAVGVAGVTWLNEGTGGRGAALGTTTWSASVPLAGGSNVLRVTATDAAGNTTSALLFVTLQTVSGDTLPPILSVTSPSASSSFFSITPAFDLGGIAADNVAVSNVVWFNTATGQTGSADGRAVWDAGIPLIEGANAITIEAFDTSGNSSTSQVTVDYRIPPPPPNTINAGHCGSVGLDLLLPLGLLWLGRRVPRRRRRYRFTGKELEEKWKGPVDKGGRGWNWTELSGGAYKP
ncbi:MAG: hypothetical protein HYY16_19280, partial [Planctomycetes bacterium]|nr:hypothetical protein [Planctomycetota bacterium]